MPRRQALDRLVVRHRGRSGLELAAIGIRVCALLDPPAKARGSVRIELDPLARGDRLDRLLERVDHPLGVAADRSGMDDEIIGEVGDQLDPVGGEAVRTALSLGEVLVGLTLGILTDGIRRALGRIDQPLNALTHLLDRAGRPSLEAMLDLGLRLLGLLLAFGLVHAPVCLGSGQEDAWDDHSCRPAGLTGASAVSPVILQVAL